MKCIDCYRNIPIEKTPVIKINHHNEQTSEITNRCIYCQETFYRKTLSHNHPGWCISFYKNGECLYCKERKPVKYLQDEIRIETVNMTNPLPKQSLLSSSSPIFCCEDCWTGSENLPSIKEKHPEIWMRQGALF